MEYKPLQKDNCGEWIENQPFAATVENHFQPRTKKPDWSYMTKKFNAADTISRDLEYYEALQRINNGGTWIPTIYTTKNDKGFKSGKFFAVDFEQQGNGKIPQIKEELERAEKMGIPPIAYYSTMSSTDEKPRFRFLWEVETPIETAKEYKRIAAVFINAFSGTSDGACKSAAQFFAGGHGMHYAVNHFFIARSVIDAIAATQKTTAAAAAAPAITTQGHSRRKVATAADDKPRQLVRHVNWDVLCNGCKLWRDTISGAYWAGYSDIQHLALSAHSMEGGALRLRNAIRDNPQFYNNDRHNIDYYLSEISTLKKQEHEERCSAATCPFYDDCGHMGFITDKTKQNTITLYKEVEKPRISLENAEKWLNDTYTQIAQSGRIYHLVKAPTGIGKTEALKNIEKIFCTNEHICIIQPTHALKEETENRLRQYIPDIEVQKVQEYEKEEDTEKYKAFFAAGLTPPQKRKAATQKAINKEAHIKLMTQAYYLEHQEDYTDHIIICDEDIWLKLINYQKIERSVLIESLRKLKDLQVITKKDYRAAEDFIDDCLTVSSDNEIVAIDKRFPHLNIDIDRLYKAGIDDYKQLPPFDVFLLQRGNLLAAKDTISIIEGKEMPKAAKFIILSATADIKMYNARYPELDIESYVCPPVEHKGSITWDVSRTYSKYDLQRADIPNLWNTLKTNYKDFFNGVDDVYLITYKAWAARISKATGAKVLNKYWIGATEGKDGLKGQKILIVGANRLPDIDIAAYGSLFAFPPADYTRCTRRLRRCGFEFNFYGFSDPKMEQIYEWIIDSSTIQDIGRARLLRTAAQVLVCGLPVEI